VVDLAAVVEAHGPQEQRPQHGQHRPVEAAEGGGVHERPGREEHHTLRGPEHVNVELRPLLDAGRRVVGFVERLSTVRQTSPLGSAEGLVGRSPPFNGALAAVQRVARSALPVLLLGETGTGKELFARAVHEASERASGPFVVVDCSGLTETLFESELFGHENGAFTGAAARKKGLVETAQGGTLFLDEIGDVPIAMQVKLLRLIESGTFRRVGGVDVLRADFRLVAATHKPLARMVAEGLFRADLYYRINVFPVHLPALRERASDIPLLVDAILRRNGGGRRYSVQPEAMALMQAHAWPGNIRELRNVLERAKLFADDGVIRPEHLPGPAPGATVAPQATHGATTISDEDLVREARAEQRTRRELAQRLGMSERTLYRRLRSLGMER
jgi:transcriptional regulator with PAS, ATPase and Fis domain